jgi:dienelactone hydrolase
MRRAVLVAVAVVAVLVAGILVVSHLQRSDPAEPPVASGQPELPPAGPPEEFPEPTGAPEPPNEDSFYTPPKELRGSAGTLLRYRPVKIYTDPARGKAVPLVRAWQILYRSTSAEGKPNAVSGTVVVPQIPYLGAGPKPVVSYAFGTHGLADRCAPSYRLVRGTEKEGAAQLKALLKGWAVVMTDYEGLGTPGEHTYAVHLSAGRSVLDAARAAMRLPPADLSVEAPVGLMGYSQGGGAVLSAAEQAAGYAPDLKVVGAAAGGVPADPLAVARSVANTPLFGLVPAGLAGLDAAYPELHVAGSLGPSKALLTKARNSCEVDLGGKAFSAQRLNKLTDLGKELNSRPVAERFAENRLGGVAPKVPVLLFHGERDEFIPFAVGRALFDRYCGEGARVQFKAMPGKAHGGAAVEGVGLALDWMTARFSDKPAPTSCD